MQEIISLNIANTTNGIVPISILGNNADAMDNSNASTQYQWNLTGFTITNENTILLQYKTSGIIYTFAQLSFSGTTIQSICDTLNTLNLGYFFITTSGGSTFINNYNNNVAFATLQIFNPASTTALNYQFNYSGVASLIKIYVNAIVLYSNGTPNTDIGNVPVVAGNLIDFQGSATATPTGTNIYIYNITTSTFIYNNTTTSSIGFLESFTIVANNSYIVGMNN
tara:strand:+ start:13954 stop:14625 length:672 start_codon:yes stop_codon:yes gene_type:complete